jgi:hypothetical protein
MTALDGTRLSGPAGTWAMPSVGFHEHCSSRAAGGCRPAESSTNGGALRRGGRGRTQGHRVTSDEQRLKHLSDALTRQAIDELDDGDERQQGEP